MARAVPVVMEIEDAEDFIHYVLDRHPALSTLIICSSKDAFFGSMTPRFSRTIPTLRQLSVSRTLKLAFCPDITHLRAYLNAYRAKLEDWKNEATSSVSPSIMATVLAILNPIQLHVQTSAFSAQGLNRTLSAAVEAAHDTGSRLLLAECPVRTATNESMAIDTGENLDDTDPFETKDLWNDEVSILNVTTKSFGAGERGWAGRTVKIRTIAERWFTFQRLPTPGEG